MFASCDFCVNLPSAKPQLRSAFQNFGFFLSLRVYLVYGHLSSLNFDLDSSCPPSHLPKRQPVSYAAKWQWARARSLMSSTALAHDRFLTPQSRYSADRDTEASAGMSYSQLPNAQIFFLGGGGDNRETN